MLKILHVVRDLNSISGGPSRSIPQTAASLVEQGISCTLLAGHDGIETTVSEAKGRDLNVIFAKPTNFHSANSIERLLRSKLGHVPSFDVVHVHGLWSAICHAGCRFSAIHKLPYVISPRGMLEHWALNHKRWKKMLALWLYQMRDLKRANLLHATSNSEGNTIGECELGVPILVVPNGVQLPLLREEDSPKPSPKLLLFLSRIHPVKGIESLLEAWSLVQPENWRCQIVGPGEKDYRSFLQRRIIELGISSAVEMKEAVDGEEKWNLLRSASVFILPSHSENFGMAIAEALASELPVITTRQTPWRDIEEYGCGWWVTDNVVALSEAIRAAVQLSPRELQFLGKRGRKLIEEKYSWPRIAAELARAYQSLLR